MRTLLLIMLRSFGFIFECVLINGDATKHLEFERNMNKFRLVRTISRLDFMLNMFLKRNVETKRKDFAAELNVNFRLRLVLFKLLAVNVLIRISTSVSMTKMKF